MEPIIVWYLRMGILYFIAGAGFGIAILMKLESFRREAVEHKCLNRGTGSDEVVLIPCEHKGQALYVCVRCLPILIHGSH